MAYSHRYVIFKVQLLIKIQIHHLSIVRQGGSVKKMEQNPCISLMSKSFGILTTLILTPAI